MYCSTCCVEWKLYGPLSDRLCGVTVLLCGVSVNASKGHHLSTQHNQPRRSPLHVLQHLIVTSTVPCISNVMFIFEKKHTNRTKCFQMPFQIGVVDTMGYNGRHWSQQCPRGSRAVSPHLIPKTSSNLLCVCEADQREHLGPTLCRWLNPKRQPLQGSIPFPNGGGESGGQTFSTEKVTLMHSNFSWRLFLAVCWICRSTFSALPTFIPFFPLDCQQLPSQKVGGFSLLEDKDYKYQASLKQMSMKANTAPRRIGAYIFLWRGVCPSGAFRQPADQALNGITSRNA